MQLEDCYARYGVIQLAPEGGLVWSQAPAWLIPFSVPHFVNLRYGEKVVHRIFMNRDMVGPLAAALDRCYLAGVHNELKTFDGCFNVRWVRGVPGVPSFHCWGVAIDFNAKSNPLGGKSSWSNDFVNCFKSSGFTWGGDFKTRPDPMHFQLSSIPK